MANDTDFGALLRGFRRTRNLTHKDLCRLSGVSVRAISNLELGVNARPRSDTVRMLADGLRLGGVERDQFYAAARGWPLPAESPPAGPHNLSGDLPEFVGREPDIATVRTLVRRDRLVTLTGPGGVGKTRLALEVARGLLADFADGVWFVDLAPLHDPALVAASIAAALGIGEAGNLSSEERLLAHLQGKRLLLLLDNFEHLLAAAPLVARLLDRRAGLRVLATSRARLKLPGESPYPVPPLLLPDRPRLAAATLADYEAVALFLLRARFARQGLALPTAANETVAAICRLLDGLPLAIELAAARCAVLSPTEVRERLADRLSLLSNGRRTPTARHQSLRTALDWSCDLLGRAAQRLFQRLAVFVDGATLEAIERVCNPAGDLGGTALDALQELVESNLVRAVSDGEKQTRYLMLATIHEYALALWQTDPAALDELRDQHANYLLEMCEGLDQGWLDRPEQVLPLDRNQENLRAAHRWLLHRGDGPRSLRLIKVMLWFWNMRGLWSEARQASEATLALAPKSPTSVRATVLMRLGFVLALRSDYGAACAAYEESISIARSLGDEALAASGASNLGSALWPMGDLSGARNTYVTSLAFARKNGDKRGIAVGLHNVGLMDLYRGELVSAHELFVESLDLLRETGLTRGIPTCLMNLAEVALHQGEHTVARELLNDCLAQCRANEEPLGVANCQYRLGLVATQEGHYDMARSCYVESLRLLGPLQDRSRIAAALEGLAACLSAQDQPLQAVHFWGAAAMLRQQATAPLLPIYQADYDERTRLTRESVDEASWTNAWSEGQAWSIGHVIELAIGTNSTD